MPRLLTLPTSFADDFISDLAELNSRFSKSAKVFELYGSFQHSSFHSARPAKYLPLINKTEFKRHIHFNYLLNAPSYTNFEYTHESRRNLEELQHFYVTAVLPLSQ